MVDFPWSDGEGRIRILIKQRAEPIGPPERVWIIDATPQQVVDFEAATPDLIGLPGGGMAEHMTEQTKHATSWGASGTL